jgi:hypothetical protein
MVVMKAKSISKAKKAKAAPKSKKVTPELDDRELGKISGGVENPTTIGSATGGAGAGKIKFREFTIKKTTDSASPIFIG